jgi:hypothetical protein
MVKSKANSKLKNVQAVRQMLDGTHKFQTKKVFGYVKKKDHVKHEIGDIWTETDPVSGIETTWEQRDGFKLKCGKLQSARDYLNSFSNCPKEICTCIQPGIADKKMKMYHGMCLDCVVEKEHEIRLKGHDEWNLYENKKIHENAKAWMKQAEKDVKGLLKELDKTEFVNKDGSIEKWNGKSNKEKLRKEIKEGFEKFKTEFLSQFEDNKE